MISVALVALLAAAPKIELGAVAGMGYMPGSAESAVGRDEGAADAIREPWSAGAWLGYQWLRGHDLGLRFQYWKASKEVEGLDDYGGGEETIVISAYGVEYTRLIPMANKSTLRFGGGVGFANAKDDLKLEDTDISAKGDGWAGWTRGGVSVPLGSIEGQFGLAATYVGMTKMKSRDIESFETSYLIVQAEIGLSFGL